MKKIIRCIMVLFILAGFYFVLPASAEAAGYCIEATPAITEAAFQYLDDIYIDKYPQLALEYSFGSEKDRNTLKALAGQITSGLSTSKQKVNAIVDWVETNIQYVSYHSGEAEYFAIDTYYAQKGNCLGISQLIVQLCRLSNIKAVMCCGTRGDMANYISLDSREMDHAWVMINYAGVWRLYDPLFSVYGKTDKAFISRWYFTDFIEGVTPYVKAYAKYMNYGNSIFYIDGRFVHYVDGIPASEYFKMGAEGGTAINWAIPYFAKTRYDNKYDTGADGFNYVENPSRKEAMINDECYSDGWITYGTAMYYAKPNGILAGSTLKEYNGDCYYLPFGSDAIKFPGKSTDYTFTKGFPTLFKGKEITVEPPWADSQINNYQRVLVWESQTPETISVTADGVIKGLKDGYACVSVCSKNTVDSDTHYMFTYVEFWVSSKERTVAPKTDVSKLNIKLSNTSYTYDGLEKTPSVTVTNSAGKTLKKDTDYTVTYASGRKNVGTYKVTVKMKGNYTGTKTLSFKIKPISSSTCTFKLSTTAYTYNGKAKTPSVTVTNSAGKTLKKDTDYTVTYASGRKNAGTYKVTVKMTGNYTGTKTLSFKINPASSSKFTFKLSTTAYTYNGKAKTPSVTVKDSAGNTLKKNTDYTATYASGRKNVGTYKVTVKMTGNYTGTKTLSFKIVPRAASINNLTAKSKALTVKLNRSLQQSTGYQVQYATNQNFTDAKTVVISNYKTNTTTIKGLKAKKTYYVRVRTYTKVGKTTYYSNWSSYKSMKTK